MTNIFIEQKVSTLKDEELLKIINEDSKDYTPEALLIAEKELEKRKISEESETWYYSLEKEQFGPVAKSKIKELVASNTLKSNDNIWRVGWKEWVKVYEIKDLFVEKEIKNDVPPPLIIDEATKFQAIQLQSNGFSLTGFILGIISIFLGSLIGILPILAIIFSGVGLGTFNPKINKSKWQAITGLILGILYTLVYLVNYGHIRS